MTDITPNQPMPSVERSKATWIVAAIAIIVLVLGVLGAVFISSGNPEKQLDGFLAAIEAQDEEAVYTFVAEDISNKNLENIGWFVEDWVIADSVAIEKQTDKSWHQRDEMIEDESGNLVPKTKKNGTTVTEIVPITRYASHFYEAELMVTFSDEEGDEYEDPVIIRLRRETDETWSIWPQLFADWKVVNIKYQPFDEEDYDDIELGDDEFIDLEDADFDEEGIDFELDEDGNIVDDAEEEPTI